MVRRTSKTGIQTLANLRHVSQEAVEEAHRRGWLSFVEHRGKPSWRIGDAKNGCVRSLDGTPFKIGRELCKAEAETKGDDWHRLIGLDDVVAHDRLMVLLVEGIPDALAALHFAACEGTLSTIGIVIVLGEGARLLAADSEQLCGRKVRIVGDATPGGMAAAEIWGEAIVRFADEVQLLDLRGLRRADGAVVKDLNDCTRIHADDYEENRELWGITDLESGGRRVRVISKPPLLPLMEVFSAAGHSKTGSQTYREAEKQRNGETEETEKRREREGGEEKKESCAVPHNLKPTGMDALLFGTIPSTPGETNRLLFVLAGRLRREAKRGADLPPLVKAAALEWLKRAGKIADGRNWEDVVTMLEKRISRVRSAGNPFLDALEILDTLPPVEHPILVDRPKLERLARLCRVMGERGEFSLSTRQAAQTVGAKDASTGGDYLDLLEKQPFIECTKRGIPGKHHASRFRYIGPQPL